MCSIWPTGRKMPKLIVRGEHFYQAEIARKAP